MATTATMTPARPIACPRRALDAFKAGVPHRITFESAKAINLGPLTWIERGQRKYAHSKTVSLGPES